MIYKLTIENTIEDKLLALQATKSAIAASALDGGDIVKSNKVSSPFHIVNLVLTNFDIALDGRCHVLVPWRWRCTNGGRRQVEQRIPDCLIYIFLQFVSRINWLLMFFELHSLNHHSTTRTSHF